MRYDVTYIVGCELYVLYVDVVQVMFCVCLQSVAAGHTVPRECHQV